MSMSVCVWSGMCVCVCGLAGVCVCVCVCVCVVWHECVWGGWHEGKVRGRGVQLHW